MNHRSSIQKSLFSTTRHIRQLQDGQITEQTTTTLPSSYILSEEEASKSAPLVALHKRLNLPSEFSLGLLARSLTCRSSKEKLANNQGLNILGKNFMSYYVTEYLMSLYPRLPLPILNTAVASYLNTESLYAIGKYSWGIEVDESPILTKLLNKEPIEYSYGKVRFLPVSADGEKGIVKVRSNNRDEINPVSAYALAVRSVIGGVYTSTKSEAETKKFIYDHILSRKLDVGKMFEFEQPTRELSKLCKREGLEKPVARLLAENGRNSNAPVFVIGVFSGEKIS